MVPFSRSKKEIPVQLQACNLGDSVAAGIAGFLRSFSVNLTAKELCHETSSTGHPGRRNVFRLPI
jgi:hypothetical protein